MSYEPHTWVDDETITAAKLNAMEQGIAQGGGYDAEIYVYRSNNSSANYEVTIRNGSFSSLYAMCQDAVPPTLLVRCWDENTGYRFASSFVAIYDVASSYITFHVKRPTNGIASTDSQVGNYTVHWYSDDEISVSYTS